MPDYIDVLLEQLRAQQPVLINLAALAAILTFVLAHRDPIIRRLRRSVLPGRPKGHTERASQLWRAIPIPYPVLRWLRLARGSADRAEMVSYLEDFARDLDSECTSTPVPAPAGTIPPRGGLHYYRRQRQESHVRHIRQQMRLLSEPSRDGDASSAQVASVSQRNRPIRNAVRTLQGIAEPIVLLGDPGSGKSYALRRVAIELSRFEMKRPDPKLVVFVSLRNYTSTEDGRVGSVRQLIADSISQRTHHHLKSKLQSLTDRGRVVVIFDGMDEMPRKDYSARVGRLSRYAKRNEGLVKTLFSCRTADFGGGFVHRRVVLERFGSSQMVAYFRRNLGFPLSISGSYIERPEQLARALREHPSLGELGSNPLMLFFISGHIAQFGTWPTRRAELFRSYIARQYRRRVDWDGEVPGDFYGTWAALAYRITRAHAGTVGDVGVLSEGLDKRDVKRAIDVAAKSGLILREPERPHQVVFVHHQLQEYLTAEYLASHGDRGIPWTTLLDHPRWQETLVSLSSIQPDNAGIAVLGESLVVTEEVVEDMRCGMLDDAVEADLADRALLASRILRETETIGARVPDCLGENYRSVLRRLADEGRPTSQAKMVWCWKQAPDEESVAALTGPLRSRVTWVRDQAVEVVCAMAGARRRLAGDLGFEIGVDFVGGHLCRRIGRYWAAIRAAGSWWSGALLVAALALRGSYVGLLGVLVAVFVGWASSATGPGMNATLGGWGWAIAGFAVVSGVVAVGKGRREGLRVPDAVYWGVVVAAVSVVVAGRAFAGEWGEALGELFVGWMGATAAALAAGIWHWAIVVLYLFLWGGLRGSVGKNGQSLLGLAAEQDAWQSQAGLVFGTATFAVLVAGMVLVAWLGERFEVVRWLFGLAMVGWVMCASAHGLWRVWVFVRSRCGLRWAAGCVCGGLGVMGVFGWVLFGWPGVVATAVNAVWGWLSVPLVRVGVLAVAVVVGVLVGARRVMVWLRGREEVERGVGAENWEAAFLESDGFGKVRQLSSAARDYLGLRPVEFLDLLRRVEQDLAVWMEPVATPYWRLREEVERSVRQDGLEGMEGLS